MSTTMNTSSTIRWQLLSTVSAAALLASAYTAQASGNDADRSTLWIELGGQMENVSGQGEVFAPPFLAANPTSPVFTSTTPLQAQKPATFSFGEQGKILFQPASSDWIFSAAIRIGRSSDFRHVDHQTNRSSPTLRTYYEDFADTQARRQENHTILDFSAGKDIGLGIFGKNSSSTLSLGVRFAQFASTETFDIRARPDFAQKYITLIPGLPFPYFHTYHATGNASRSFRGVGPSLSWSGSTPFIGNPADGEVTLDWGANAALLFGRQKAQVRHQETAHYENIKYRETTPYPTAYPPRSNHSTRSRSVTVPNVGGFAGISFQHGAAKVSFGYRADFFFGAMDAGIDAHKSQIMGFKGPFASISIGLGD